MEFNYCLKNIDVFVKKIKPFLKNKLIFIEGDLGISKTSEINKKSSVGKDTYIGPFSVIESGVKIGENTKLGSNVFID